MFRAILRVVALRSEFPPQLNAHRGRPIRDARRGATVRTSAIFDAMRRSDSTSAIVHERRRSCCNRRRALERTTWSAVGGDWRAVTALAVIDYGSGARPRPHRSRAIRSISTWMERSGRSSAERFRPASDN
jgi:hypothetical protein